MATPWRLNGAASSVVALLLVGVYSNAMGAGSCVSASSQKSVRGEVNAALAGFGARTVALGRVDSVSRDNGVEVLGLRVMPTALEDFQVGDYAVVVDWSRRGSRDRLLEVRQVAGRYVPGASEIYLKSKVTVNDALSAKARLGSVNIDYSRFSQAIGRNLSIPGSVAVVRGTQPEPRGAVLSQCVAVSLDGSLGTGKVDGSLGTGRTDGSLGTGRAEGSLGTGRKDGSLGTGRKDGSLGTGRADGSLGTGRTNGSLGTGRTDGSLGTGWLSGSLGTGRSSGSLGTGKADGSLGTGRAEGS